MDPKICLVTGATSGIGAATAEALMRSGATVVIVGRNPDRLAAMVDRLRRSGGPGAVEAMKADLSSQADVRALAHQFLARHHRLDVLVNNAGAVFSRRQLSVDRIEMTFALNHLAYFQLSNLLLDVITASAPARIVNVSSSGHTLAAQINFADLQFSRGYGFGWRAYFQSKLANLMFTYELARRLDGSGVTVNALDPGMVSTNFGTNNGWGHSYLKRLFYFAFRIKPLTPEEGARTAIYLASSPEVEHVSGRYFVDQNAVESSPASHDAAAARRLWELSEELTNLHVSSRELKSAS
jgi:NAD(P)-dependent dehydrogenase (short-subunit alcohol dehydrogenase family)